MISKPKGLQQKRRIENNMKETKSINYKMNTVILGDNLSILRAIPEESFSMIYVDPPFNTGKVQRLVSVRSKRSEGGNRDGFGGNKYTSEVVSSLQYADANNDYIDWLRERMVEAHRILKPTGTMYVHLDYREVHYARVMMDEIFGRKNFLNEIIWAYDYGARAKRKWPTKHDNILVYVKDINQYYFNTEEVDREPYMAPGLVTPEKAARGKLPTDTWWHTIVSPTGKEKTGYPTQKPEAVIKRMVLASTKPGDSVLDFFAGSGTLGAVAIKTGRRFTLIDSNRDAVNVIKKRLGNDGIEYLGFGDNLS